MSSQDILAQASSAGRKILLEDEAGFLLRAAGVPVNPCQVAANEEEVVQASKTIGFPVVLKVRSPAIIHKTDVGGVQLGLEDEEAVRLAYRGMMEKARLIDMGAQATVQAMALPGLEILVGMTTDVQFGPVIAFGLGGIMVELYQDLTFRQIPLLESDAADMLHTIKGKAVLQGYRGFPAVNRNALIDILLHVSRLVESEPRIKEIDLNPVLAYPDGALAVDARVVI